MTDLQGEWTEPANPKYRCMVYIHPAEEGGYWVEAANLPGACSQGETIEEALANIKEALEGVIASYLERDGTIPWEELPETLEPGTIVRQVIVEIKK